MQLGQWLNTSFYGNDARTWFMAFVVFIVGGPALLGLRSVLINRVGKFSEKTAVAVDDLAVDVLKRTHGLFLFLIAGFAASLLLDLSPLARERARVVVFAGLIIQLGRWGSQAIRSWAQHNMKQEAGSRGTVSAVAFLARVSLWAVIVLLMLDNFGLQVTALITTLGVGGIAVALAAQSVLGDLLAAVSIFLDKPFVVGDFIIMDGYLGTIDAVGLRSTRIKSLSGEQIIISNADLIKSRIRNYKEMQERRVVFPIRVRHGTPYDLIARVPEIIRSAIEVEDLTRFDRAHLSAFGESSLDFEAVYYVLSPDYNVYMDIQQAINLTILRRFEEEGIAFAHPVRLTTIEQAEPRDTTRKARPSGVEAVTGAPAVRTIHKT